MEAPSDGEDGEDGEESFDEANGNESDAGKFQSKKIFLFILFSFQLKKKKNWGFLVVKHFLFFFDFIFTEKTNKTILADNDVFSVNGLEIDLKELELFEKRVKEKRAKNPQVTEKTDENSEPDDLDEYLQKLTLENNIRDETIFVEQARAPLDQSMPLLIYTFCGILFLLNYLQHSRRKTKIFVRVILFKFTIFKFWISGSDEGLEEDDDDDDDADEEEGDISLGEFFFFTFA